MSDDQPVRPEQTPPSEPIRKESDFRESEGRRDGRFSDEGPALFGGGDLGRPKPDNTQSNTSDD